MKQETKQEMKKVNFNDYQDKFDEKVLEQLRTDPKEIDIETMRATLYGFTFTEDYANGTMPDELSMNYWKDKYEEKMFGEGEEVDDDLILDDDVDLGYDSDLENMGEEDEFNMDMYETDTPQERLIMETIDSTGDGKSEETALCVIDVFQEYEYLSRVFPYSMLDVTTQYLIGDGIDCLEFDDNPFGVKKIYFDVKRRFEVGYPFAK